MSFKLSSLRQHYHVAKQSDDRTGRPWRTGVWRRAPSLGLMALLLALLCGVAIVVVLIKADDLPLEGWRVSGHDVQPAVLISIFATVANALFRFAFTEAITISWWTRSLKGTNIRELHQCWNYGQSSVATFWPGKSLAFVAIASLSTLVIMIDGPILQRASTVQTIERVEHKNLTLPVSPTPFMRYATGIFADHVVLPNLYTPLFATVLQQYKNKQPIVLPDFGCKGACDFDLIAPGWNIECLPWSSPFRLASFDEAQSFAVNNSSNTSYTGPYLLQTMFWSNVTTMAYADSLLINLYEYRTGKPWPGGIGGSGGQNRVRFSSMVKATPAGNGTLNWRDCLLLEAVQRYPVTVQNNTLALRSMPPTQNYTEFNVLRESDLTGPGNQGSTVGGLWLAVNNAFDGRAAMETNSGWLRIRPVGDTALSYLHSPNETGIGSFDVTWQDPIDDMITMIRELSLRVAVATTSHAPQDPRAVPSQPNVAEYPTIGLTDPQTDIYSPNLTDVNRALSQQVAAHMIYTENVYKSRFDWLWGAMAVFLVTFVAILPVFRGWWNLGRRVSLSPIETAKAFDAPLLRSADGNGTLRDTVAATGHHDIAYGALNGHGNGLKTNAESSARRLRFGGVNFVNAPTELETFAGDCKKSNEAVAPETLRVRKTL